MIVLPPELDAAVAARLQAADPRQVARMAQALSGRYRGERTPGERLVRTDDDAIAYAAWILPATHAQVSGALRMIPLRAGAWSPSSLLDLGAGPGTTAWAATSLWPGLERVVAVEREPSFTALGRTLAAGSARPAVRQAEWRQEDLRELDARGERFDLVVLAHVAGELASGDAGYVAREAWAACDGVMVVVEPGTPQGFARVEALRRSLLAQGARILAPCPHEGACPLSGGERLEPPDWCHFAERAQRPGFQKRMKGAELSWEDAKFAFVAVARFPSVASPWARVLRHPLHGKGHADLDLCARDGRRPVVVGRSAGAGWKLARKLEWGSAVEAAGDLGLPERPEAPA